MNALRLHARDAAEAVGQIRSRLGPDAVVLSVTPLPVQGFSRLWRKPRIEVVAALPEAVSAALQQDTVIKSPEPEPNAQAFESPAPETSEIQQHFPTCSTQPATRNPQRTACSTPHALVAPNPDAGGPCLTTSSLFAPEPDVPEASVTQPAIRNTSDTSSSPPPLSPLTHHASRITESPWRTSLLLHQLGLDPLHVEKVLERARTSHGHLPPAAFGEEMALMRAALASFWRPLPRAEENTPPLHVFIGPPGSGKTTALCKWLAKSVLAEGLAARAWRLDARAANFAGLLDFYGEILGVTVEREWRGVPPLAEFDIAFIDLPGTQARDTAALQQLRKQLQALPAAQVHLVLNAAYEPAVLLAQARAFASLPVSDLIFTHLDEEKRRGKLWNLVLGTKWPIRFLAGGQNIPGEFCAAAPDLLISR